MERLFDCRTLALTAVVLVLLALAACTQPNDDGEQPPPGPPPGEGPGALYMHTGTNFDQGLYALNTQDGTATKLGLGIVFQTGTPNVGFAGRGPNQPLLGATSLDLYEVRTTGEEPTQVASSCGAAGLAYDVISADLYRISHATLTRVSPATCAVLETLTASHELGALAIDSAGQRLYGIGDADGNLYALDLAGGAPFTWTVVFDTGVSGWDDAGLAFDQENGVLYAVGHPTDGPGLYRIDPTLQSMERVGDTGLTRAYGGLAWRYEGQPE